MSALTSRSASQGPAPSSTITVSTDSGPLQMPRMPLILTVLPSPDARSEAIEASMPRPGGVSVSKPVATTAMASTVRIMLREIRRMRDNEPSPGIRSERLTDARIYTE